MGGCPAAPAGAPAGGIRFAGIAELGKRLRAGELSCPELTEHFLRRIDRFDPARQVFITVSRERALREARCADAVLAEGRDLGPLQGIPYAVKDNLATAGVRTTANSRALDNWIPEQDAPCVKRLADAGAVLLGKLTMNEYGYGNFPLGGYPQNPWNPATGTGGSSAGLAR